MQSELIVDVQSKKYRSHFSKTDALSLPQKEARDISYAVGDIYLAKVKKLMPGLNAAFVSVGYEKDAFLHYLDLGTQFDSYTAFLEQTLDEKKHLPALTKTKLLPDIDKHGAIAERLKPGQELMVQIVKEPISSKALASRPKSLLQADIWC